MSAPTSYVRNEAFEAERLLVEDLAPRLEVAVTRSGPMTVRLTGEVAAVKAVEVECDDRAARTLRVRGLGPRHAHAPVVAVVAVPITSAVTLRRVGGEVRIGDLGGPLLLDLADPVVVRARSATELQLSLGGDSRAEISAVDAHYAEIDVNGRARVLLDGQVRTLVARVRGLGNVHFRGVADHADLDLDGPGAISVSRIRHTLRRRAIGSGEVRVAFPPPFELPS